MSIRLTPAQVTLRSLVEGTLKVDKSEQALVDAYSSNPFRVMGYVDLCNLVSGDRFVIREYIMIKEGGEYRLYDTDLYEDEQEKPLIYVESKESSHGIKVTIKKEAGRSREIDYQFFKTKV